MITKKKLKDIHVFTHFIYLLLAHSYICSYNGVEGEHMYEIRTELTLDEKLEILSDAAKYDVACTSSGVARQGKQGYLGNSCPSGVCHTFAADGRCISLLKILMSNQCEYDCKYCKSRKSNDIPRATFTPDEICTLTIEFYKRNYIEGLFLSSGVIKNPDYTMEKMCETVRLLRTRYRFNGYIHLKVIPGASEELLYSAGLLADRISINMELPTQDSLTALAPNKNMKTILNPMNKITNTIARHRVSQGENARFDRAVINKHLNNSIFGPSNNNIPISDNHNGQIGIREINNTTTSNEGIILNDHSFALPAERSDSLLKRNFAPAGQSTQMIIGAGNETDFELIKTSQSLYRCFDLRRVFYSGYIPINDDPVLPSVGTPVPLLREHRLYQADWLLRYYGFHAEELLSETRPNFDSRIDPKCEWALRNLGDFPVEINKASYDALLRVPGIGPVSVKKIMSARRYSKITFPMLKKMGVVLKRAQYFITCNGQMLYRIPMNEQFILDQLTDMERPANLKISGPDNSFRQMNLFDDFNLSSTTSVS